MNRRIIATGYSNPLKNPDIILFEINDNGHITANNSFRSGENPTFICTKDGFVYIAEENDSYSNLIKLSIIDNKIVVLKKYVFKSRGLCHISAVETGLLCSFYISGDLILIDDELTREIWRIDFNSESESPSHIHWTYLNQTSEQIFITDLGAKAVYAISASVLKDNRVPDFAVVYNSDDYGPRQVIGMTVKNQIFIINEIGSTVASAITADAITGKTEFRTIPSTKHKEENFPSVAVTMGEKYLLVANRGANSISVFDTLNNNLKQINEFSVAGNWPRHISFTTDYKYLLVCNQISNEIVVFKDVLNDPRITDKIELFGAACTLEL